METYRVNGWTRFAAFAFNGSDNSWYNIETSGTDVLLFARFNGVEKYFINLFNINDVEKYIGFEVYSDQDITLEEDEFLVDDLIGLTVYNEQKELIGEVLDVISIPSNDILEIKTKEKKILIPFINDYIVEITDEYIIIKELEIV